MALSPQEGPGQPGAMFMFFLNEVEMEEMRLAMAARARATGSGTARHEICKSILRKLTESEKDPKQDAPKDRINGTDGTFLRA